MEGNGVSRVGFNKVTSRRSRLEIYLDILRIIRNGTRKPTRIMYAANISWKPMQRIINSMVKQGLIMETDALEGRDKRTNKTYEITQKGNNIINYFNRAKEFIELEKAVNISTNETV